MRTVKEVSKLTGVSVRTLHHYDAIGLLRPTQVTDAGYRLYDDTALNRLQTILLFRELAFPLKEIRDILDSPHFDPSKALAQQIALLELKQKHLADVLAFAREIQKKGVDVMAFQIFDQNEIEQYKAEVKATWGDTVAYQEFAQRGAEGMDAQKASQGMMELFKQLGALRHLPPEAPAVQEKVAALQCFLTQNCYNCTPEMLGALGQMYVEDERFKRNIDQIGGEGTAAFAKEAIAAYCARA